MITMPATTIHLETPEIKLDTDAPEVAWRSSSFYPYWPGQGLGLYQHPTIRRMPVLCGIALRPIFTFGFHALDADGRKVSVPKKTIRLSPATAAGKLGAELRSRCLDGTRLRPSACAANLRAWVPVVARLTPQAAPLAHAEPVASAIDTILAAMRKAGELPAIAA